MKLLLIRHGQTTANVERLLDTAPPGDLLDPVGEAQAEELVNRLAQVPLDALFVSDLVRTQQTAAPLAASRGLHPRIRPGIREIQAGDYEMSPIWAGYIETITAWFSDPQRRMPGAERGPDVLARFDAVVREARDLGACEPALVTHGAIMRFWASSRGHNLTPGFVIAHPLTNTSTIELTGDPDEGWTVESWAGARP